MKLFRVHVSKALRENVKTGNDEELNPNRSETDFRSVVHVRAPPAGQNTVKRIRVILQGVDTITGTPPV